MTDLLVVRCSRVNLADLLVVRCSRVNLPDLLVVRCSRVNLADLLVVRCSRVNLPDLLVVRCSRIKHAQLCFFVALLRTDIEIGLARSFSISCSRLKPRGSFAATARIGLEEPGEPTSRRSIVNRFRGRIETRGRPTASDSAECLPSVIDN